jgi:hypothetical protein
MKRAQRFLLAVALTSVCTQAFADKNLLPNGDFSQPNQLTGWSCLGSSWSSDDAASIVGSGSMALQNTGNIAGSCTSACIRVKPGAAYSLGGQSRVLLGQPVITFACAESGTAQCNSFTFNLQVPAMSTANVWNTPAASTSGILGSGTFSLNCKVTLGSQDLGSVSAHFDNLFFTTDVIFAADFEGQ